MQILQFTCAVPQIANALCGAMVAQANIWSRLAYTCQDPAYVTSPFDASIWHTKVSDPTTYWSDYDSVYAALTDAGRLVADQMFGPGPLQGTLLNAQLKPSFDPNMKLSLSSVADPVAAGYLLASVLPA